MLNLILKIINYRTQTQKMNRAVFNLKVGKKKKAMIKKTFIIIVTFLIIIHRNKKCFFNKVWDLKTKIYSQEINYIKIYVKFNK